MNNGRSVLNAALASTVLLLTFSLFLGCASQKTETLSQKLADQQRQISNLQRENIEMKSRMEEQRTGYYLLEKRAKDGHDRLGEIQARVQSLEATMQEAKGQIEVLNTSMGKAPSTSTPSTSDTVASPLSRSLEPPPAEAAASAPEPPTREAPPKPEPAAIQPPTAGAMGSQELYNQAMKYLKKGEPGQAILEFERYIREFPLSELTDNAQYWIGEAYYVQREYARALSEFQKVLDRYPQGDKVPDAQLKISLGYLEMGQKEKAVVEMKKLLAQYPDSAPASLARKKLAELSK